ncbi:TniQ family protein [Paenibacillus sp. FSL P2-0173]|uniref:TniQ family protein n=1 Tax=Paenibacillus sp. FSL P2-0173 TaxID=2921627 RepID=UPI0030F67037
MFTIRLKPFRGESLSSYMSRCADANGIDLLTLWKAVKPKNTYNPKIIHIYLIDFTPESSLNIAKLARLTAQSSNTLLEMTFYFIIKKFTHSKKHAQSRFLRGLLRRDNYYCPICFREKNIHMLLSRVEAITRCRIHHCFLLKNLPSDEFTTSKELNMYKTNGILTIDTKKLQEFCSEEVIKQEKWIAEVWQQMLSPTKLHYSNSELALKVLYIMNDYNCSYDKSIIQANLKLVGDISLNDLLSYARRTLARERSFHIKFLIEVMRLNRLDFNSFARIDVPSLFQKAIQGTGRSKKELLICLSPWCKSYNQKGSLIKTGTSTKYRRNGDKYTYHVACLDCGCLFAFNSNNELEYKDPFLKGFHALRKYGFREMELKEMMNYTGFARSTCRHILAYFRTRGVLTMRRTEITIENKLLSDFIQAIQKGKIIMEIEKWSCWSSVNHFLTYRYHLQVMRELVLRKKKAASRIYKEEIYQKITDECSRMIVTNETITIEKIAKAISVSTNTIRKWNYHIYIKNAKKTQAKRRLENRINLLISKAEEYVKGYAGEKMLSKDIYNYLKVKQSYICSVMPAVSYYIERAREEFNSYNKSQ